MYDGLASRAPRLITTGAKVAKAYHPRTWKEKGSWWTAGLFLVRTAGLFLVTYLVIVVVLGMIWSTSPGPFDVKEKALGMVNNDPAKLVAGVVTVATAIGIAETLLNKSGGYLTNDITPPGVYLDNIPNWEFGALTELRGFTSALRNDFARAQSQSVEDADLQLAEPRFNYESNSWVFPSTESEYRGGVTLLKAFMGRLYDEKQDDGQFVARADNLGAYLQVVEKRLGSLAQRLSYAVGQAHLDTDLGRTRMRVNQNPHPLSS